MLSTNQEKGPGLHSAKSPFLFSNAAVLLLGVLLVASVSWAESVPQLDSAMFEDPRFDAPEMEMRFSPRLKPLWIEALGYRETDLKQQAAFTIAWSHQRGMKGLDEAIEPLTKNLTSDPRLVVRVASARALAVLDASEAAEALFERSKVDGLEMAQIVEPALARWDFTPIRESWRKRLEDVKKDRKRSLLAIRGLGEVKDEQAVDAMRKIAMDASQPPELRMAAADSLRRIRSEGLEDSARELAARTSRTSIIDRVIGARFLSRHSSEAAKKLLVELAQDDESSVAAIALNRLLEIDLDLILPLAESALTKGDVNVRWPVAKTLVARPTATSLTLLGDLMADPHPKLRVFVTDSLYDLAETPELHPQVVQQGERMLHDERWQALEQSLRLLGRLDREDQSDRFIELVKHQRTEVYVTAAWGLRHLAVDRTRAPLLEFAQQRHDNVQKGTVPASPGVLEQLVQLFQYFGQAKYEPAEPLLRTFVPKGSADLDTRAAAIWALGYIHQDKPDTELVKALEARIRDVDSMPPEDDLARRMSAVAIGRMKAREALNTLQKFRDQDGVGSEVGYACAWAIEQITGETFEEPATPIGYYGNFFLEPLKQD
ncbi:MAG: HEAT repeat domain-containing protein [Planctomycetes bacterium]|nr:HEAT repeat domain-containing protein [Planctomycetota bacterium]MBL7043811.1 HEAT repeat domain-containing protein [Pirellulaceae bacterium]